MPPTTATPSRVVPAVPARAVAAILAWFDANGRSFPFRGVTDPFAILVSETMAQQTQIGRATEKWSTFMARFPTIEALAAASPSDVVREWRGLGYNRRALNLWRAAGLVVAEHGGRLPRSVVALERLPGVGPYTARAVAALAFGQPVGAVDTNVRRVLGRMVGGENGLPIGTLQAVADAAVPRSRPGDWTHAVMDVGSRFCRPARPDCPGCPASAWCRYATDESADRAPRRRRRTTVGASFSATSRWLRGRLVDRLRDGGAGEWVPVPATLGEHGADAVDAALTALAAEGFVERHPTDATLVRLALAG